MINFPRAEAGFLRVGIRYWKQLEREGGVCVCVCVCLLPLHTHTQTDTDTESSLGLCKDWFQDLLQIS